MTQPPQGPPPDGWRPPPGGWPPPQQQPPPPGSYPPPPGYSYPPPPPGWYPPPPPPGWGPPPQPWGKPSAGALVGAAYRWGWQKFKATPGPLVVAALPYLIALLAVQAIQIVSGVYSSLYSESFSSSYDYPSPGAYVLDTLTGLPLSIGFAVVNALLLTLVIRVALAVADGRPVTAGTAFSTDALGPILLASVLVTVAGTVGVALCILPGLVVYLFLQFTYLFVLDQRMSALAAMRASAYLVRDNLGPSILIALALAGTYLVGMLACCVGVLFAVPLGTLAQTYLYRRLQEAPIAP